MKLTVSQLKKLIRESFEPFVPELQGKRDEKAELYGLFRDMYKEKHNVRPDHVHPDHVSVEDLRARIEDLHNTPEQDYDDWGSEEYEAAERAELDAMDALEAERKAERDALGFEGQDEEGLPKHLGMGHHLYEGLKAVVLEAIEECNKEEESVDECGDTGGMLHGEEEAALEEYLAEAKKSMRLGGGGRFEKGVKALKAKGKSEESAKAIMASAGRKKYGKAKMAQWAEAGKKRAAEKKK